MDDHVHHHMEQVGDIVERVLIDIEDKKIKKGRSFSDAGMPGTRACAPNCLRRVALGNGT